MGKSRPPDPYRSHEILTFGRAAPSVHVVRADGPAPRTGDAALCPGCVVDHRRSNGPRVSSLRGRHRRCRPKRFWPLSARTLVVGSVSDITRMGRTAWRWSGARWNSKRGVGVGRYRTGLRWRNRAVPFRNQAVREGVQWECSFSSSCAPSPWPWPPPDSGSTSSPDRAAAMTRALSSYRAIRSRSSPG